MPTIRLATDDDMRSITSKDLSPINVLPHVYISVTAVDIPLPPLRFPVESIELMRSWGVAQLSSLAAYVRLYPGCLVAPRNFGQFVDRAELLYYGAEPAADFLPLP